MRKMFFIALLMAFVAYSLEDITYGTSYVDSAIIEAADFEEDKDTVANWTERNNDSMEVKYVRFTDYPDSTIDTLRIGVILRKIGNAGSLIGDTSEAVNIYTQSGAGDATSISMGKYWSDNPRGIIAFNNPDSTFTIKFNTANSEAISIPKSTGFVGVDTTAPASKLHVAGSGRFRDTVITGLLNVDSIIDNTIMDSAAIANLDPDTVQDFTVVGDITGTAVNADFSSVDADTIRAASSSGLFLLEDGDAGIFVEDGGNVGIGLSDPTTILEVRKDQNGSTLLTIKNDSAGTSASAVISMASNSSTGNMYIYDDGHSDANLADKFLILADATTTALMLSAANASGEIQFYTGSSAAANKRMTITAAGFVGIDTTTPGSKLHVAGSARVRDTLFCNTLTGDLDITDSVSVGGGDEINKVAVSTDSIQFQIGDSTYSIAVTNTYVTP